MGQIENKFNPSMKEIYARGEALQWMIHMGWSMDVIDSIMMDDNPNLQTVRTLVYRFGPKGAFRRLQKFLS